MTTQCFLAPAKINLHLHITGKRDTGYHTLDSWVAFLKLADTLTIRDAENFALTVDGPYAQALDPTAENLIEKAWRLTQKYVPTTRAHHINLTKNIPLGAGLGGGSSDAATFLKALKIIYPEHLTSQIIHAIAQNIGSDVPPFLHDHAIIMGGIGELSTPAPVCPPIPIVLIYPNFISSTPDVYKTYAQHHHGAYTATTNFPEKFDKITQLCDFLKTSTRNDLYNPATMLNPAIKDVITALEYQNTCLLARMSGSGSSCFGIFEDSAAAHQAATRMTLAHPDWHITTTLCT